MSDPWGDLVSTALLGTDRRPLDVGAWPPPAGLPARALGSEGPERLLEAAALVSAHRRAGFRAGAPATAPPAAALPPVRAPVPPPAAARLAGLLAGAAPDDLLREWLEAAGARGRRVPAPLLAPLLDRAAVRAGLHAPVAAVLDTPGRWLAAFRPDWARIAVPAAVDVPPVDRWTHGSPAERGHWLTATRRADPDAGRAALEQVWGEESAAVRERLLAVLVHGLGAGDEPLLERALDDRAVGVRVEAARLLARLPGSAFTRRWSERAAGWVGVERLRRRVRLAPGALDTAGRRDAPGRAAAPGVLAAVPAAAWHAAVTDPARIVGLPVADADPAALRAIWTATATRDEDVALARVLLDHDPLAAASLLVLLPAGERAGRAAAALGGAGRAGAVLLEGCPRPWPPELTAAALLWLRRAAVPGAAGPATASAVRLVAARAAPGDAAPALRDLHERLPPGSPLITAVQAALALLTTRHDMIEELA